MELDLLKKPRCFVDLEGKIPATKDGDLVARLETGGEVFLQSLVAHRPIYQEATDMVMFRPLNPEEFESLVHQARAEGWDGVDDGMVSLGFEDES